MRKNKPNILLSLLPCFWHVLFHRDLEKVSFYFSLSLKLRTLLRILKYGQKARDLFPIGNVAMLTEEKKMARNVIHRLCKRCKETSASHGLVRESILLPL